MTLTTLQCGMPSEAALLKRVFGSQVQILTRSTITNLDTIVSPSCTRIASIGLCGGLAPDISVGDIVSAGTLISGDKWLLNKPDKAWNIKLSDYFNSNELDFTFVQQIPYYSSGLLGQADTVEQRAALFKNSYAEAIDDESFAVAQFAAIKKIPYIVLRSVSDQWDETLPPAATGPVMNPDGSANTSHITWSILKNPFQIPALIRTGLDYSKSLNALETALIAFKDLIVG